MEMDCNLKNWPIIFNKLIEGVVRKPCHENNGAAIYVGRATTVHNPLLSCSHYS